MTQNIDDYSNAMYNLALHYGYNKNYDQLIDTFDKPILTFELNKESRYITQSSDHLAILFVVKNFI